MTVLETIAAPRRRARDFAGFGFSLTLFVSAALIFSIEPMFSKMVLPRLGGSSSVWSIAMVVFQGLMLGGYAYAHLLARFVEPRIAMLIHTLLLAVATLFLPIAIAPIFAGAPPQHFVSLWVIGLFLASVGLPCFAISANAPLLQAWIARGGNVANPYLLYRASNLGSFVALIAYPSLIEPRLGLAAQSHWWSFGFAILLAAVGICGFAASRWSEGYAPPAMNPASSGPRASARWRWIALSFIPSALLVAVTAHIATDVASAPFIWILPLALYLITFVLVFSERPSVSDRVMLLLQPASVATLAVLFLWGAKANWGLALLGNLAAFFVATMVCHARLYRARPDAADLTEFYACLSLGGVLGGLFAALLAPILFSGVYEYPLLAMAALFVRDDVWHTPRVEWKKDLLFVGLLVTVVAVLMYVAPSGAVFGAATMALAAYLAILTRAPARMIGLAAALLAATTLFTPSQHIIATARSFYGVYKVVEIENGRFRVFLHGTTAHGAEQLRDNHGRNLSGRPEPISYYANGGAYDEAITAARTRSGGTLSNVALVGLGVGAISCHARAHEHWTIYEIDPLVLQIARDSGLFRSLPTCLPDVPVVIGDGRLMLAGASHPLDLLLLDIFSSDAVPTHMLTKEAFSLYKAKLAPHGVIAFNIANHNLELASVIAASAAANGMATAVKTDPLWPAGSMKMRAQIAIVANSAADIEALKLTRDWHTVAPDPRVAVWTDDYSDVLGAIFRRMRE